MVIVLKLQQLRYVTEIVRHGNHLSAAAEALNTSQPGVSRQVQLLELELGFEIFIRTRNRIIGLTEPGELVLSIAQRIATDVAALKRLKSDMNSGNGGVFTIGTTHFQARYTLPRVVERFVKTYPQVKLVMRQGDPEEICQMVEAGDVDLAVGTETIREFPNLVKLDGFSIHRVIVTPVGHPLLTIPDLTLKEVAKYPIMTYDRHYSGHWKVMKAFADAGLEPRVIMSGIDADVCKTYVAMGLGIGILSDLAFESDGDAGIATRPLGDLVPSSTAQIVLRSNTYLRPYLLEFIRSVAPALTPGVVRQAVQNANDARTSA